MLPPDTPPCPLCHKLNGQLVRQYDNYPAELGGTAKPPTSTVFVFACQCGCSFAVTVPLYRAFGFGDAASAMPAETNAAARRTAIVRQPGLSTFAIDAP